MQCREIPLCARAPRGASSEARGEQAREAFALRVIVAPPAPPLRLPRADTTSYNRAAQRITKSVALRVMHRLWVIAGLLAIATGVFGPPAGVAHAQALPAAVIRSVRVSNVRDIAFTVTWVTDVATGGQVRWGPDGASTLTSVAGDRRGDTVQSTVHSVTVSGVSPATTYRFDVVSGATTDSSGGTHYAVTTGATLGLTSPDVAYGTVTKRDGGVPDGAIVTLTATSAAGTSAPLTSVMVAADAGYWVIDLGGLRTATLDAPFALTDATTLTVSVDGGADGLASGTVSLAGGRTGTLILKMVDDITMPLQAGWNLVALRATPSTATKAAGLCSAVNGVQAGTVVEVDRWVAGGWEGHRCGVPPNNFVLDVGPGYFVRASLPATWTYRGALSTTATPLSLGAGWNLVGASATGSPASEAKATCTALNAVTAGTVVELDQWVAGGWVGHRCGIPPNNFTLVAGRGYFIRLNQPATWAPVGIAP